jgi:cysteine sulfinate desulfinase/cysteine desulfurase-like protein
LEFYQILLVGSLRITFGRENSIEDVKYLVDSLEEIISKLRK